MAQKKTGKKIKPEKSARPANARRSSAVKKKRLTRRQRRNLNVLLFIVCAAALIGMLYTGISAWRYAGEREDARRASLVLQEQSSADSGPARWEQEGAPYIDVQLLTPNEYSRPQIGIEYVNYIAIHYTANPGSTAQANRNYFENLAATHETKVSSHFVVGLEGEVIQCIPTSEMSYATNSRNVDSVSIECCHMDETGVFENATYQSVVKLAAWLCTRFGLTEENVIRHYDVTGKSCPKYYVDHPEAWTQMKADIAAQIQEDYVLQENLNQG
ncbi:MAG: peptidoglycan recognition family protein [Eubacteriales bacterium]|nr:peptidoglycan recognition family protein [Eubacteriales bacterium]